MANDSSRPDGRRDAVRAQNSSNNRKKSSSQSRKSSSQSQRQGNASRGQGQRQNAQRRQANSGGRGQSSGRSDNSSQANQRPRRKRANASRASQNAQAQGQSNKPNNAARPRRKKAQSQSSRSSQSSQNQNQNQNQNQSQSQNQRKSSRGSQNRGPQSKRDRSYQQRSRRGRPPKVRPTKHHEQRFRLEHPNVSPQISAMKEESQRGNRYENRYERAASTNLPQRIQDQFPTAPKNTLRIIPLGGLCEIGKNMYLYEYGDDLIVVDAGTSFPEEMHPGIDLVIPDMNYLVRNKSRLRGIFITHGHEDHIGALPWLVRLAPAPIYCTPLTAKLIDNKLRDKGAPDQVHLIQELRDGDIVKAGNFKVEYIHVNHSIADACALAIHTPAGVAIHSGDFKVDYTPIHGEPIDLARFAELGEEGVLLFLCESTNVEREGFSMSEKSVGLAFKEEFAKATGRVFVATFSSNVHRVQQVITAAESHGRKVVLLGRSMLNVFSCANELGYITMKKDTIIGLNEVNNYPDDKLCIVMTGSQGEPLAALTRIAYAEHRNFQVCDDDTFIISATPIPGNEKSIYRVIDELYKRGARVVYSQLADVHVSGHAYADEIRLLHSLIKPKYFVPIHGEYRMLYHHAELAHDMGQSWESIFLLNNGDILALSDDFSGVVGYTKANPILIDGRTFSPANTATLQERTRLSEEGVVSISLALDSRTGRLKGLPALVSYGFVFETDTEKLEERTLDHVQTFIERQGPGRRGNLRGAFKGPKFRRSLENFLFRQTGRNPVVLVTILDV